MIAPTVYWENRIREITALFIHEFGQLSEADLNWKPGPDRWSIAQVIQHIITTNESYFPVFNEVIKDTYKNPLAGKIPLIPYLMGKLVLKYVQPDMKKRSRTVEIWEPSYSIISLEIIEQFNIHQEGLISKINSLEFFLNKDLIIHSPANKNIIYPLDTAIEILVSHEERHLNQAREILNIKNQASLT